MKNIFLATAVIFLATSLAVANKVDRKQRREARRQQFFKSMAWFI